MDDWSIRVGHGWKDEKLLPDVDDVFKVHSGHGEFVFSLLSDAHLEGTVRFGEVMYYGHSEDKPSVTRLILLLESFISELHHPNTDVISLIFVNFMPKTSDLSEHPPGKIMEVKSIIDGLGHFCSKVTGSLREGKARWSECEWAMLTCSKIAKPDAETT